LARTASTNGKVQILSGTEFIEPFDMVIKAIGEEKQAGLLRNYFQRWNWMRAGHRSQCGHGQTNLPKVFTGGDCANGGREVVNAVAEGRKRARAFMHFSRGK